MIEAKDITVIIPSVPPRARMLQRAVQSVMRQTIGDVHCLTTIDKLGQGAVWTRNHLLERVQTPWVAFLDDDDEFLPMHLEVLARAQEKHNADVVFSNFLVPQSPGFVLESFCYGVFDPENPKQTTITTLTRMSKLMEVGGFRDPAPGQTVGRDFLGEDHDLTKRLIAAGAVFWHEPKITWLWSHHGNNLSGMDWHRKYPEPVE